MSKRSRAWVNLSWDKDVLNEAKRAMRTADEWVQRERKAGRPEEEIARVEQARKNVWSEELEMGANMVAEPWVPVCWTPLVEAIRTVYMLTGSQRRLVVMGARPEGE